MVKPGYCLFVVLKKRKQFFSKSNHLIRLKKLTLEDDNITINLIML